MRMMICLLLPIFIFFPTKCFSQKITVELLKKRLKKNGFFIGEINNKLDSGISTSLIKFQESKNLSTTGIFDIPTLEKLEIIGNFQRGNKFEELMVKIVHSKKDDIHNKEKKITTFNYEKELIYADEEQLYFFERQLDDYDNFTLRIANIQLRLKQRGFDPGPIDNVIGKWSTDAILGFQKENNISQTGIIDIATLYNLGFIEFSIYLYNLNSSSSIKNENANITNSAKWDARFSENIEYAYFISHGPDTYSINSSDKPKIEDAFRLLAQNPQLVLFISSYSGKNLIYGNNKHVLLNISDSLNKLFLEKGIQMERIYAKALAQNSIPHNFPKTSQYHSGIFLCDVLKLMMAASH